MDVSIIIVNYNTIKVLLTAIASIVEKCNGFSYEIIIVDNNSSDSSQSILTERYCDRVKLLYLPENIGFGRANNEGIKVAKGRNVIFLNPDIQLLDNSIKILSDYLDSHSNVGIVGGNLYTPDLKPGYSYNRFLPGIFTEEFSMLTFGLIRKLIPNICHNLSGKPLKVGCTSGADFMIRREVLEKIGSFDPQFFMYYEDTELNWRIKNAGYKIINVPIAKFIHLDSQSFDSIENKLRMSLTSRVIYLDKVKGKTYRFLADRIYLIAVNLHIFMRKVLKKESRYYLQLRDLIKEICFN